MKAYRLAHGITQSDMSRQIGINRSDYCLIENGRLHPTENIIVKFEKTFNMPFNELMYVIQLKNGYPKGGAPLS